MRSRFNVYEYKNKSGSICYFSEGVSRDFGENRTVFTGDRQIFSLVMPLHSKHGLSLIGYILVEKDND